MKKFLLVLAASAALSAGVFAQEIDSDINQIALTKEDSRFHADLHLGFPMYFGTSALVNTTYKGAWASYEHLPADIMELGRDTKSTDFMDTQIGRNFVYGLEMASLHFTADESPLDISLGLRWTFMDFTFKDPGITLRPVNGTYLPSLIALEASDYDGKKSKIHATYLGVPLRFTFQADDVRAFVGASAEYRVGGYTKYKNPKHRAPHSGIFSPFRATVEAGVSYKTLGLFVSYGLTPLFPEELSDARTLSFGIIFGR